MGSENKITDGCSPPPSVQKLRWVLSLLTMVLAVLAVEVFYYYSPTPFSPEQKALLAWQGVRAPDLILRNLESQTIHLADLKGKRVILNFWATWCPPCVEEVPNFVELRSATSPTNIVVLGVSTDDAASQRDFSTRHGLNYPLTILENAPSPYQDVAIIPVTMMIDRHGVLQHVLFGPQDFTDLKKYSMESDFTGTVRSAPQ